LHEEVVAVAAVTVRDLDDGVKERLRVRAAVHGRSMESEIRAILTDAVSQPGDSGSLFIALYERVAELGGVEIDIPQRSTPARSADFSR